MGWMRRSRGGGRQAFGQDLIELHLTSLETWRVDVGQVAGGYGLLGRSHRQLSAEGLNDGYTHGFIMTFESPEARDAYLPHPIHEEVKDIVVPNLARVVVFDFNCPVEALGAYQALIAQFTVRDGDDDKLTTKIESRRGSVYINGRIVSP